MAAPMQQMPGQLMPQQQNRFGVGGGQGMDFGQYAFQFIQNTPYVGPGWQTSVAITERVGKAQDLITNAVLATPNQPWQRLAHLCVQFESNALRESPDKATYEHKMRQKSAEMHARRQGQVPQLQESMNAQAAQRQQQMIMMNQQRQQQAALMQAQMAGRGGGPNQAGFQHLQNPMQVSQLPQQAPQMGLNLSNGMTPQMNPGQQGFSMPQGPQRGPEQQQLSDADKQKIQALAQTLMQQASDAQKQQMMQSVASRLPPQRLAQMRAEGQNPLAMLFQQEATKRFMMARRHQMQKQGMPPNTPGMQMQPGQQRAMNPNMMNSMGQSGGQLGQFGNMESIMNEQKQGLLAEQAGQLVVPASSGPGRNATPQPLSNMQPQNMFSQGPNQTPRPQMPNGFDLQQQQQQQLKQQLAASQAHAQAQIRAQAAAKGLQGQPGGLSGPMPASQSPAMDNLNAPVRQPPVAMGQMGSNQGQPGNPQFNQGLDPRFNQQGGPGPMAGNPNMPQDPAIRAMLAQLDPEQRQKFRQLPPDKLAELFSKWKRSGMLRPGQAQPGLPMNPANAANPMGNPMHQPPQGGMGPQMQQPNFPNQMNRMRGGNPLQHPQAQMIMDNMDLPPNVTQNIPGIPPDAKKWGQFKAWVSQTNAPIPDQQKAILRQLQVNQFRRMVASHGQGGMPQQPGAPAPNAMANLPPNTPIPEVTPQEIQQFRMSQQNFREAPEEQIRAFIQRLKIQRMQRAAAMGLGGQPPSGQPATTAGTQPGVPPTASGPQQGMQPGQTIPAPVSAPEPSQTPVAPGPKANRPPQPNMAAPPNPSPAAPTKNLKRPGDDLEATTQPNANNQRPASQPTQLPPGGPIPNLTPEQLAKMTPEQRQKYELMRQQQMQEMLHFKSILQEETKAYEAQRFPDVPMTAETRAQMTAFIQKISQEFTKLSRVINHWFRLSRDEARLRAFVRTRLRVLSQFQNNNTEQPLKENLTMTRQEMLQSKHLLDSMMKDLASTQKGARPPQQGGPATTQQPPQPQQSQQPQQPQRPEQPAPAPAPTPLNEANLAKQTQALNKAHQRSNSKSGQPPAAPTSAQPPFPFGATSPDGAPRWVAPTPLTQEKLQLPNAGARKRVKTAANAQASSPAVSSQNASPQTKVTSPELKRKEPKPAPKPAFMCTEPGCELADTGFPTEEARKQHHQEVHVLPYEDPQQFMQQSFATAFGLDENGQTKSQQQPGPEEATPMSREASIKQQGGALGASSVQGPRPGENKAATAAATGPKPGDKSTPDQVAPGFQQSQLVVDPLANTTIDPQSLMAPMMHLFDPAAGGVISDMTLYQSTTPPEDTPESSASKDSGVSEPNSDIPETANLEIDMNWQNFDDSTLVNGMAAFGMDMELNSFEGMASFPSDDMLITEDMLVDLDKPFTGLDSSLYELNSF
ncbi:hypothetical protein J7T55_007505 [Diaporthe amygdali]|uniref:uncharacterized protein n=1 Tax=Phomopsis amygdali TaxID=1214568 RepID=UPI0022FE4866|nr:uncharacterized protein J7T55_007505 [Diaporthe amygdali]KAJ0116525.1 hypothetical protein J7T55_007505 [Diaporthe amygdali]